MEETAISQYLERLVSERDRLDATSMNEMFKADEERFSKYSTSHDDVLFDYSKNRIDQQSLGILLEMAKTSNIEQARDAMFAGEKINTTENRAVLHTALRADPSGNVEVDGKNVMPQIAQVLERMRAFTNAVHDGSYQVTGGKITDVVNIGIGGSDLGPRMVTKALKPYHCGPRVHFVANVDGSDIADTLENLDPKTTLFIIASKTFSTQETMANAHSARAWMQRAVGENAGKHFCALSTNLEATRAFGIEDERTFGFWDWVGGRYSVWSAIGLSVMLAIGVKNFDEFLLGARAADQHFCSAPLDKNIPVLMALFGVWYRDIWEFPSYALLPYDNRMEFFPNWLQQLDMESNGKSVTKSGKPVLMDTGPMVFGTPGTNGQHAYYQLIHQGTQIIPCDFLCAANSSQSDESGKEHHRLLLSNVLAQSEALMRGRSLDETGGNPHKVFEGNRPSNTFLYPELTPKTLGTLMAYYEHKIFVQGVIWGINSFDQWGVELGKELANKIAPMLSSKDASAAENTSTQNLIEAIVKMQG